VFWAFLDKYKIIFGALLILIGLFELILGNKILNGTIFFVACFSVLAVSFLFIYQFVIPAGSNPNIMWVVLGISVILGLGMAFLMLQVNIIFFIGLGGLLGYVVGTLAYNLGLNRIQSNPEVRIKS
jgi:hypothetical protein